MEILHHRWQNQDRRTLVYRPGGFEGPWPLVLFLPGTGGTAEWAADEARLPLFAALNNFVLVVPEALPPFPDRVRKFLTNPPRWNDGSMAGVPELQTDADDVGFLAAVIADVHSRMRTDPRRVYATGFSNGAGMTFRFAAERGDLIAAIAPVAGYCTTTHGPAVPVPTLFVSGSADPLVPLRGGQVRLPWGNELVKRPPIAIGLERWAAASGCEPFSVLERDINGVRIEVYPSTVTEFRSITVDGLGHHWPGGRGQLSHRIGGAPSNRCDANAAIWEFFQRHSR